MTRWDKLLQRLYSMPNDMRYEEIHRILTGYGYLPQETAGGSSHITYRKPGHAPITIPRHGAVKKAYVRIVRDAIEEEHNDEIA